MTELQQQKNTLNLLIAQRDALELEANAIHSELMSPGLNGEPRAGISDSLIDAEGFPRGDIDIYHVKGQRKRLSEINTDYKLLMKQIEPLLHQIHQSVSESTPIVDSPPPEAEKPLTPFAKLSEISSGSPAESAGILENDFVLKFGGVNIRTENAMSKVVQVVGGNVNAPIALTVLRTSKDSMNVDTVELTIVPKPWGGRGLLGCRLDPINQ